MAEIEHFLDPKDKSHQKYNEIKEIEVFLYSAKNQVNGESSQKIKIGDAVQNKIIDNQTLGFFIARIYLFLTRCGVNKDKLRFRQHTQNEMAHYAIDCWDAECLTTYGWVECVGCADRSFYDLTQHMKHSGVKLEARRKLDQPKIVDVTEIQTVKIGKLFKKDAKIITAHFENLDVNEINEIEKRINATSEDEVEFTIEEKKFKIKKANLSIKRYKKTVYVEEFVPSVIEPSFGIGRIMYVIWEHNFKERDAQRTYLALPPVIAPYKCSVLPLSSNDGFKPFIRKLSLMLTNSGISHKIDDNSGSIGRRYARTDEIAIPFAITIDFDSLKEPHTVTLRERDSMQQIRVDINEITGLVSDLADLKITWQQVLNKYPLFEHHTRSDEKDQTGKDE